MKTNRNFFSIKDVAILGIAILFALIYSVAFSHYFNKQTPPSTINNYTIKIETTNYTDTASIPSGAAGQETIEKSLQASVRVSATGSSGTSYGSGSIFSQDEEFSYIITCHHVIDEARASGLSITIYDDRKESSIYNGTTFNGTNVVLVGSDPETDIAVLKFKSIGYENVSFIESNDDIYTGQPVYSIGNSLGVYPFTCTTGVINQAEREVPVKDLGTFNLIQTDSATNPGVSGGGLFDTNGVLVGMINSGYSSDVAQNINFAIPAYDINTIAEELMSNIDSSSGFGYIEGRYKLSMTYDLAGSSPYYPMVVELSTDSSFYDVDTNKSLRVNDVMKSVKIGDNAVINLQNSANLGDIFQSYDDEIEVGTQIIFVVSGNKGLDAERTATITVKQYVFKV